MSLSPRSARLQGQLIQHMNQATYEAARKLRMDALDDAFAQRCTWCGAWTDHPTCRRCAPTHPNGVRP